MASVRGSFSKLEKWDTTPLYKNEKMWESDLKKLEKDILKIKKYKGHILDNENTFLEVLDLDSNVSRLLERVYIYAHINNDADTRDTHGKELYGKAKNVYSLYLETSSFIVPELLKSDFKLVDSYLKKNKNLEKYRRNLEKIFRMKSHVLNEEVEECLSSLQRLMDAPDDIMSSLSDSDFTFDNILVDGKSVELTESNYSVYLRSKDRLVRESAFKSIYKTYAKYKNTIATILKSEVEKNVSLAKMRKYGSSMEASLFKDELEPLIYNNLIAAVHQNMDAIYEYWHLKKDILKLEEMHLYDTYTDVSKDSSKKYSFAEAKDLVLVAVSPLGDNYVKDIATSFSDRWIDYCNNTGKRGGAYCTSCYDVHPYVLMSYEGTLNDVSTLAHELGHAMHYYYACKYQNYNDYGYSIFVAEVASQVNEILLSRYLLDHSESFSEKLKIIDDLLQKFKSTIYRQTMFAEFEKFIHEYTEEGNVLTSDVMCNKYYELNKLYFGSDVVIDEEIKYEWERIPHFYMNFYVWEYATGFAAAVKIANDIYNGNKNASKNYLEFLKLGSTKNPIDSLKVAGVDMSNTEAITESINYMKELLEMYKELKGSVKDE